MTQTTVRYFVTDVDEAIDFTAIASAFTSTFPCPWIRRFGEDF